MKTTINYIKRTFLFNLINSQIGFIFLWFIIILALFYDGCPRNKETKAKEDITYTKSNN